MRVNAARVLTGQGAYYTLAFALCLSLAGYFLVPTGRANNFPTFLMGLVTLPLVVPWLLRLGRSWVMVVAFVLCSYMALSLFWSRPLFDEKVHSVIGNYLLVMTFVAGIVLCQLRFATFCSVCCQLMVAAACLSALVYLVQVGASDGAGPTGAPLGRWEVASVGAIGYGMAALLAINLGILAPRREAMVAWWAAGLLLVAACLHLATSYVAFALLAGLTALAFGQVWRMRASMLVIPWMVVTFTMMVLVILVLNAVIDSGRQFIWSSVLDLIYAEKLAFGFGIRAWPGFHMDCSLLQVAAATDCSYQHPHNIYVATMFYGGIVGIACLVLLMVVSVSVALGAKHSLKWLVTSLLTFGFAVLMFDGNRVISKIDFVWLVFWLPVAMSAFLELEDTLATDDEIMAS